MAWINEDAQPKREKKPVWDYKDNVEFITFLPDTTRHIAILTGDLDPTKSWTSPLIAWVHEFKVATGFATIICNKWNEACPYCYENELYKKANPNYKNMNGRLPYGLSKKALLQVWDFQEKKVLWMLAGKHIQEGMDFIMTKMLDQYKGIVSITRMGDRLQTSYRVDILQSQLDEFARQTIQNHMVPVANVSAVLGLTRDDLIKKTSIDPVQYFATKLPLNLGVDISSWGRVPLAGDGVCSQPPVHPAPGTAPRANEVPPVQSGGYSEIASEIREALTVVCTTGVYKDIKLVEVILQTGKPYIQYLIRTECTKAEKDAAMIILERWPEVEIAVKSMEVPF